MNKNIENKIIEKALEIALTVANFGVEMNNEMSNSEDGIYRFYFSVPEFYEDNDYFDEYRTGEEVIAYVKKMIFDFVRSIWETDPLFEILGVEDEELKEYVKCFAKIRRGEIWTKEMAIEEVNGIKNGIKTAINKTSEWKEV